MIMKGSREGSRVSNHSIRPEAAQVNEVSGNRRRKDSIIRKGSRNRKRFIEGAPGFFKIICGGMRMNADGSVWEEGRGGISCERSVPLPGS